MAPIAAAARNVIETEGPGLSVKLAWGFPCWSGNERIFSIAAYKDHCNLQLWSGARLAPGFPARIEGNGLALRHIKLKSVSDIDDEIRQIIIAAIALDQSTPQRVR